MKTPRFPDNESQRQKEIEKYQLLDTLPEESYDSITSILANICEVPIAFVAILDKDRNFLKSHYGIQLSEDPRSRSFCGHTILEVKDFMIVSDASQDERFHDNPLVTEMGVRFYAGASLINPNGFKLGTLCVFDTKPKILTEFQFNALVSLSKQVVQVMENHFKGLRIQKAQIELEQRNQALDKLNATLEEKVAKRTAELQKSLIEKEVLLKEVHHRVKNNLQLLSSLLNLYGAQIDNEAVHSFINEYKNNLYSIALVHENLYQENDFSEIDFVEYIEQLSRYFAQSQSVNGKVFVKVICQVKVVNMSASKAITSGLIINELLANAYKHAYENKKDGLININIKKKKNTIVLSIADNGVGLAKDIDRQESTSSGLEIVSILADQLEAKIKTVYDNGTKYTLRFEA